MSITPEINWAEGMFLRPHHLQAATRHLHSMLNQAVETLQPYGWGIRRLEISDAALGNFMFTVQACQIRMKDGVWLSVPENADIEPRDFKEALDTSDGPMDVFIGLPRMRERDANTVGLGESPSDFDRRYKVRLTEIIDENTGTNSQQIETRRLAGKLFFGDENSEGYDKLRIARLERSGGAQNVPLLDSGFTPSVLVLDAWAPLRELCHDIYHRLAATNRSLASQIVSRDVSFGSEGPGGAEAMLKLKVTNEYVVLLRQIINTPSIHPYNVYLEICRLTGELAVFGDRREAPDIPVYDHDQLGPCFFELSDQLERLLDSIVPTSYSRRAFEMVGNQLQCQLDDEWVEGETDLYIGIESDHDEERVVEEIGAIKIAATGDVSWINQRRLPGLRLQPVRRVPVGLPDRGGSYYYKVGRTGQLWEGVQRDKVLAVSGNVDPGMQMFVYILLKR